VCLPVLLFFFQLFCTAQAVDLRPGARLEIPCKHETHLPSQAGHFVLVGETRRVALKGKCLQCVPASSRIWLEDSVTHARTLLLDVERTASAAWSPDGEAFYVEDDYGSNGSDSYLYLAGSMKKLEIVNLILAADSEAKRFVTGHAYFQVERWVDSRNVQVRLVGHTDEASSTCFERHYLVSLAGEVKKLSARSGSPDKPWCRF